MLWAAGIYRRNVHTVLTFAVFCRTWRQRILPYDCTTANETTSRHMDMFIHWAPSQYKDGLFRYIWIQIIKILRSQWRGNPLRIPRFSTPNDILRPAGSSIRVPAWKTFHCIMQSGFQWCIALARNWLGEEKEAESDSYLKWPWPFKFVCSDV